MNATERLRKYALINIKKIKPYCNDEEYEIIIRFLETGENAEAAKAAAADASVNAYDAAVYDAAVYDAAVYDAAAYAVYDAVRSANVAADTSV